MKPKRLFIGLMLLISIMMVFTRPVSAEEDAYSIRLRRDFGYGAGSNVRGTFTISLVGDENQVTQVEFVIDDTRMALVEQPPFRFQFHTDDYGFGPHHLKALVTLRDGRVEETAAVRMNFISPENERGNVTTLFVGMGAIVVVSLVIFGLVQALAFKRKPQHQAQSGRPRQYGVFGGAICPKCALAFPRHAWGLNLLVGKLDRCEHCGKWSITVRATPEQLREAELAEFEAQQKDRVEPTFTGQARDKLEDTRYIDQL
jgi:hypothetical protein